MSLTSEQVTHGILNFLRRKDVPEEVWVDSLATLVAAVVMTNCGRDDALAPYVAAIFDASRDTNLLNHTASETRLFTS